MRKRILLALVVLSSCQTGPTLSAYKAGSNFAQRQADFDECKISSLREIPQAMATSVSGGYYNPGYLQCNTVGTFTNCSRVGAVNIPATASTYDANQGLRDRYIAACMQRKGYDFVQRPVCQNEEERRRAAVQPQPDNPAEFKCSAGIDMNT